MLSLPCHLLITPSSLSPLRPSYIILCESTSSEADAQMFRQAEGHRMSGRVRREGGMEGGRKATANNIYPPTEPNRLRPPAPFVAFTEGRREGGSEIGSGVLTPWHGLVCCTTRNVRQSCAGSVADEVLTGRKEFRLQVCNQPFMRLPGDRELTNYKPPCWQLARTTSLSISLIWAIKRGCFSVA